MQFFHLSHTDLDGYSCQFLSKKLYPDGYFVNANYGEEVRVRIDEILKKIEESASQRILFLITDLNLNEEEAKYLDSKIAILDKQITLQLLDHHLSGLETAQKYSWYHLDATKSATKITYEYLGLQDLDNFVNAVNAVDIWLQNDSWFEFGKVLMRLVDSANDINRYTFNNENQEYKHYCLERSLAYLEKEDGYIALDDAICAIKKDFFKKEKNDTFDNLLTTYIVHLLTLHKNTMTIYFQGNKGILTFGIQNSSIVGNAFLQANPDYHFFMNVSPRGTFSLRADNKMDVSKMAATIAGGGGHPNASGGKIKEFKEFFIYEELKSFIEELLKEKE